MINLLVVVPSGFDGLLLPLLLEVLYIDIDR